MRRNSKEYPLIDLHFHLDGALTLDIVEELIKLQPNKKPKNWDDLSKEEKESILSVSPDCTDLEKYLECFAFPCSLFQTPEAIRLATRLVAENQIKNGVTYFEPRFAVFKFSEDYRKDLEKIHLSEEEINKALYKYEYKLIQAVKKGLKDAHISPKIILCTMRNQDWRIDKETKEEHRDNNLRTISFSKLFNSFTHTHCVIAIDLAGGEAGNPNTDYEIFKNQISSYTDLIVHSGEAGTLEEKLTNIETAINKGSKRIGHGVALACVYDKECPQELKTKAIELIKQIREKGIFLEVCPTSNYQTQATCNPHPVVKMLIGDEKNGIPSLIDNITINTDNPSVSSTTLKNEYKIVENILNEEPNLNQEQKEQIIFNLHLNSAKASYMPLIQKIKYINDIKKIYKERLNFL